MGLLAPLGGTVYGDCAGGEVDFDDGGWAGGADRVGAGVEDGVAAEEEDAGGVAEVDFGGFGAVVVGGDGGGGFAGGEEDFGGEAVGFEFVADGGGLDVPAAGEGDAGVVELGGGGGEFGGGDGELAGGELEALDAFFGGGGGVGGGGA